MLVGADSKIYLRRRSIKTLTKNGQMNLAK